jgi:G3E family GTPase
LKVPGVMEVLLVSGFLGAGKTTFIKHFLMSRFQEVGKVAVIVNEVGEIGIDGTLLSGQNVDMLELTSGCICCTMKTDFIKAVQEIHDRVTPDYLVVEATGVAQPAEVLDTFLYLPLSEFTTLESQVTVVDADFFKVRELLGSFYEDQIRFANVVILNKIDLVEPEPFREIEKLLCEMNPEAKIVVARNCAVDPFLLFQENFSDREMNRRNINDHDNHQRWGFHTFSFVDERPLEKSKLIQFLEALPLTLFRLKGWVRFPDDSAFLDFTGGRYRFEPVDGQRTTALTFVGRNCNEAEILSALGECLIEENTEP